MKSTYFLPGAYWDNLPPCKGAIPLECDDGTFSDLGSRDTLFDQDGQRRQLSFRRLLNVESDDELAALTLPLAHCRHLGLSLDYIPEAHSPTHRRFYSLRLAQVIAKLRSILPEADLHLLLPPSACTRHPDFITIA